MAQTVLLLQGPAGKEEGHGRESLAENRQGGKVGGSGAGETLTSVSPPAEPGNVCEDPEALTRMLSQAVGGGAFGRTQPAGQGSSRGLTSSGQGKAVCTAAWERLAVQG